MRSAPARSQLTVLVVDDEQPALDEIAYLLEQDPRVGRVLRSRSADDSLRVLRETDVDALFLDIQMPGLSGLELAQVLRRFADPPRIVFVTAHESHAVEAFDVHAVDYVLKPVRADRLSEAVRRVVEGGVVERTSEPAADQHIPVERGGVTRFLDRSEITHVEAQGDYARLHTSDGSYLLRTPLSALEEEWRSVGFYRIHRSVLVSLAHITELRMDAGRCTLRVGDNELAVSRRHTRELRELLLKRGG